MPLTGGWTRNRGRAGSRDPSAALHIPRWSFWLLPDLGLVVAFVTLFYCLFLFDGCQKLFRDSDTGWHSDGRGNPRQRRTSAHRYHTRFHAPRRSMVCLGMGGGRPDGRCPLESRTARNRRAVRRINRRVHMAVVPSALDLRRRFSDRLPDGFTHALDSQHALAGPPPHLKLVAAVDHTALRRTHQRTFSTLACLRNSRICRNLGEFAREFLLCPPDRVNLRSGSRAPSADLGSRSPNGISESALVWLRGRLRRDRQSAQSIRLATPSAPCALSDEFRITVAGRRIPELQFSRRGRLADRINGRAGRIRRGARVGTAQSSTLPFGHTAARDWFAFSTRAAGACVVDATAGERYNHASPEKSRRPADPESHAFGTDISPILDVYT